MRNITINRVKNTATGISDAVFSISLDELNLTIIYYNEEDIWNIV
jgi:hypothetical protein